MKRIVAQCLASFSVNMGSFFLLGMTVGWATGLTPLFAKTESLSSISSDQIAWVLCIAPAGMIIGSILAGFLVDRIGRKSTIIICILPTVIAYVIMTAKLEYTYIMVGRVLTGIGIGITVTAVPLYIGEITDNEIRGSMGIISGICKNFGYLLTVVLGPYVTLSDLNITIALLGCLLSGFLIFIPESPYFYLMKHDDVQATRSLIWLRRCSNVTEELATITDYLEKKKLQTSKTLDLITEPGNRKAVLIVNLLSLVHVFSGSLAIPLNAYRIFEESGWEVSTDTLVMAMSIIILIASFLGFFCMDTLGRRLVLFVSSTFMAICLIVSGIYFTLKSHDYDVSSVSSLPFVAVAGYTFFVFSGNESLGRVILSESFSTNVKAKAAMVWTIVSAICDLMSVKFFQIFSDSWGLGTTFFIYTTCVILGTTILYFIMPETKGCSLECIENLHQRKDNPVTMTLAVVTTNND